ncbi:MAG TPA: hypothetical protein VMM93_03310 [Vicinamibacterales bacterium]|nr:hypothetical protein [Vicinamibacterales bacterium]
MRLAAALGPRPDFRRSDVQLLTHDTLRSLVQVQEPPCISIYQPTHRHRPDNQQDPIRFRNLVRAIEDSLAQKFSGRDTRALLARIQVLIDDVAFWNHTLDGLAVLASPGVFHVFQFQRAVPELAIVADSFHVKPLLRLVQSADRYQVLCVTRQSARLFEGNRDALDELDPGAFPTDIDAALGHERTEPHQTVAAYGTGPSGPMYHGHGSRRDVVDKDTERYFRAVDRATIAQFSKPARLPLVLAALPEHQPVFRALTRNTALVATGIEGNPDALSDGQLRDAAWQAVEPQYLERLAALTEMFTAALAHQKATADLADAARAAVAGRVSHLLVEAEGVRPGRLDPATGATSAAPLDNPDVGDMLDDLAEAVLRTGGDVVIVPRERMPTATGLAAVLRY